MKCDQCDSEATQFWRDLQITGYEDEWPIYSIRGEIRFGCESHPPRKTLIFDLDGLPHHLPPIAEYSEVWARAIEKAKV